MDINDLRSIVTVVSFTTFLGIVWWAYGVKGNRQRFEEAAREAGVSSIHRVSSMKEAVRLGQKLAKPGDVVILSPACSSFDMYKNMEERGMDFKKNVKSLM